MELGYRLAVEETPFIQAIRRNALVLFTPGAGGGRPRADGRRLPLPQGQPVADAAVAPLLGQIRRPRQQPRRHGPGPQAEPERDEDDAGVAPHGHPRPARVRAVPLHVHRHRAVQRLGGPDRRGRMAPARLPRDRRADPARRARASGRTASTTAGRRTTCSTRPTATTRSAASTRPSATAAPTPRSAPCARRASAPGTGPTRPCPRCAGRSATT